MFRRSWWAFGLEGPSDQFPGVFLRNNDRSMLLLAMLLVLLSGCANTGYYAQAVTGQLRFLSAREPVDEMLRRDDLDADTRRRLLLAGEVRDFARDALALPVKGQYRDYVQLPGEYPAWSVFAAPALSLEPVRWCFMFGAFCAEYRGYFRKQDAQAFARQLRSRGFDVDVSGVAAFSSLGVFDDPLTSLLVKMPDDLMVMVLLHELAHSVVFVKDDTMFNESFAQAVAEEGLRRWRYARGVSAESAALAAHQVQYARLREMALATREALAALYGRDVSDDEKRDGKAAVLAGARAAYRALCEQDPLPGGCVYDDWFGDGLNNARLNAVATYEARVPAFQALLRAHGGDLPAFYDTVRAMKDMPVAARRRLLDALPVADAPSPANRSVEETTP